MSVQLEPILTPDGQPCLPYWLQPQPHWGNSEQRIGTKISAFAAELTHASDMTNPPKCPPRGITFEHTGAQSQLLAGALSLLKHLTRIFLPWSFRVHLYGEGMAGCLSPWLQECEFIAMYIVLVFGEERRNLYRAYGLLSASWEPCSLRSVRKLFRYQRWSA